MYSSYYDYSYDYSDYLAGGSGAVAGLAGLAIGMVILFMIIGLAITVVQIIAMWKLFTKAGEEGWKSIIPIYNMIVLYKISNVNPLFLLIYLAAPIPVLGWLAVMGITIYQAIGLAKTFGKEPAYAVGLILLAPIFYMILGFGKSTYVGPKHGETPAAPTTPAV